MNEFEKFTDDQLAHLLQSGNEVAYCAVYNRYWKSLFQSAFKVLQEKEAAEDVVQEVFVSLWKRRQVQAIEVLPAYLHQAVRFQVLKAIRAGKASADFIARLGKVTETIMEEEPVLFKEMQGLFAEILARMPEDVQDVFLLNREKGMSYREIAMVKNISVKTVEKKMSFALREFRKGVQEAVVFILLAQDSAGF